MKTAGPQFRYDPVGRLLERKAAAPGQPELVERFGYDANGRLIQADNADAKLQWFHDEAGNLLRLRRLGRRILKYSEARGTGSPC